MKSSTLALVALLALASPALALPAPETPITPSVATPEGVCAAVTVLARPVYPSDTFTARACNVGVNWVSAHRPAQSTGLAWTLRTPLATQACTWPPQQPTIACVPATVDIPAIPGGPVTITVTITAGDTGAAGAVTFLGPKML